MKLAIGIDIGGTNTVIGLVDQKGLIIKKKTIKTKDHESPDILFLFTSMLFNGLKL